MRSLELFGIIKTNIFIPCDFSFSPPVLEEESQDYGACSFNASFGLEAFRYKLLQGVQGAKF